MRISCYLAEIVYVVTHEILREMGEYLAGGAAVVIILTALTVAACLALGSKRESK